MALQFQFARNTTAIKTELATLGNSLSTGRIGDLTAVLGGDSRQYTGLIYDLTQVDAYRQTATEVQLRLANTQTATARLEVIRSETADRLLRITDLSPGNQITQAARQGPAAFREMVDVLNLRLGDRSLFAGTEKTGPALIPAQDMLAAITALLPPAPEPTDIIQAVTTYFEDPAGGFATTAYLGSPTPGPLQKVSDDRQIPATPSANDARMVAVLASTAIAAMSGQLSGLDLEQQRSLLTEAGKRLHIAADDLSGLRADIGASEETVASALTELEARSTMLGIARNNLDQADPFETATALQAVQLQLETHFSAMARLSQLSLLRFL
jgi:flagellar hook-associated protein 3 FlgL